MNSALSHQRCQHKRVAVRRTQNNRLLGISTLSPTHRLSLYSGKYCPGASQFPGVRPPAGLLTFRLKASRATAAPTTSPASKDLVTLVAERLPPWFPLNKSPKASALTFMAAAFVAAVACFMWILRFFKNLASSRQDSAKAEEDAKQEAQQYRDDLVRVQLQVEEVQAAAREMQVRLRQQLKDRDEQLAGALQAAEALEVELENVKGVVRARETELVAVKAAAQEQAEAAREALKESQRKVALLEAMVMALRDKLREEEARNQALTSDLTASKAQITAVEGQKLELMEQVDRLQNELASTQLRLEQADAKALKLSDQVERLQQVEADLRDRMQAAAQKAQAAEVAVTSAEEQLLKVQAEAQRAQQEVVALQGAVSSRENQMSDLREQLQAARDAAARWEATMAAKTAQEEQLRSEMEVAAAQLMHAYQGKQAELDDVKARLATVQDQMDAEVLEKQRMLEAELAAAQAKSLAAEQQLSQLSLKTQQDEELQAEMKAAAEQLASLVSAKEAELLATKGQLEAAISQADADAQQRQQQLLDVQQQLEAELAAARSVATSSKADLQQLEATMAAKAVQDKQLRGEMEAAALQLMEAYRSKLEELDALKDQLAASPGEEDAEMLQLQQRLEQELLAAKTKAQSADEQAAQLARKVEQEERLQAEMREAAAELAQLVATKEAELTATREQLEAALSQVDEEALQRQQQLMEVQQQLEAQLDAAHSEAASAKADMQELKEQMDSVVLGIISMAKSRSGGGDGGAGSDGDMAAAIAALLPTSLVLEQEQEQEVAAMEQPGELAEALEELRSREETLRAQVARLEAELELQHDLVSARMPTDLLRKVSQLDSQLAERRALLLSLQQHPKAPGTPEGAAWERQEAALRREVEVLDYDLQVAYRSQMGLEMRQRERNLRVEFRDRKAELAAVLQGQVAVQQRLQEVQSGTAADKAPGRKVDVLALVRERLQDLEQQRSSPGDARVQQLAAREQELQEQLKETEEAYMVRMAEAEEKLQERLKELEAEWKVEVEARKATVEKQQQERDAEAAETAASADMVQQQVLEMRRLQEEMAAQEADLRVMRESYSQQVASAKSAAQQAQEQVVALQAQAAALQVALQRREEDVMQLSAGPQQREERSADWMRGDDGDNTAATAGTSLAYSDNGNGVMASAAATVMEEIAPPAAAVGDDIDEPSAASSSVLLEKGSLATGVDTEMADSSTYPQPSAASTAAPTKEGTSSQAAEEDTRPPAGYKPAGLWGTAPTAADTAVPSPPPTPVPPPSPPPTTASSVTSSLLETMRQKQMLPASDEDLAKEVAALTENFLAALGLAPRPDAASPQAPGKPQNRSIFGRRTTASDRPSTRLLCGAVSIPHVDKVAKGGEDAYFITSVGCGAMGVADGVGGWAEDGVDPAAYSRTLMAQCCRAIESSRGQAAAVKVLELAQTRTRLVGSATACVAVLRPNSMLEVANLGDSGLRVIRGRECVFSTTVQEHEFNMPYQLADPRALPETDRASDADLYQVPLEAGDIVVLGTDGLFDNMWEDQLLAIVEQERKKLGGSTTPAAAKQLAEAVAKVAHKNGIDSNYKSPWAVEAAQAGMGSLASRMFPRGGKTDDTTVVVAYVEAAAGR